MTYDEMINVLLAAKAGRKLQYRTKKLSPLFYNWTDCEAPIVWNFDELEFRVKPEPRHWWLSSDAYGNPVTMFKTELEASHNCYQGTLPIHIVEVL